MIFFHKIDIFSFIGNVILNTDQNKLKIINTQFIIPSFLNQLLIKRMKITTTVKYLNFINQIYIKKPHKLS